MSDKLVRLDDGLPMMGTHAIVDLAEEAEKRIEAIIKIKQISLKVTNPADWVDQQGKPYLQVSGAEKIANLFNISWRIDEPRFEMDETGHFTYTYKGEFSLAGRTIEVEGSRSSKDPFFKKYEWKGEEGKKIKTELPISAIDKRDVKMAALTNLLGNGISRILGIRNLQWSDLLEFAGIKQEEVAGVTYKKGGEKPPLTEPQKKANGEAKAEVKRIKTVVLKVEAKEKETEVDGKKKISKWFIIHTEGDISYRTFSETFKAVAEEGQKKMMFVEIDYTVSKYGNEIQAIKIVPDKVDKG